jgi:hypothetical protein
LAADVADTVTFALLPGQSRGDVARLAGDFRAIRTELRIVACPQLSGSFGLRRATLDILGDAIGDALRSGQ